MKYECIMCMEMLEAPAPAATVAVPQYCQDANQAGPGPSGIQIAAKKLEETPEYLSIICATTCGHIFHKACLSRWFHHKVKKECPSCRKILTLGKIFHLYPPSLSDDFIAHKRLQMTEIEETSLVKCNCGSAECSENFEIYKMLVSEHSGLLQRFADKSDDNTMLAAQNASLVEELARLKGNVPAKGNLPTKGKKRNQRKGKSSNPLPYFLNQEDSLPAMPTFPVAAPSPSLSAASSSDSVETQLNGRTQDRRSIVAEPLFMPTPVLATTSTSTSTSGGGGGSRFSAFNSILRAFTWTITGHNSDNSSGSTSPAERVAEASASRSADFEDTSILFDGASPLAMGRSLFNGTPGASSSSAQSSSATATTSTFTASRMLEHPSIRLDRLDGIPGPSTSAAANNAAQSQQPIPKITLVKKGLKQVAMKSTGRAFPVQLPLNNDTPERFSYAIRGQSTSGQAQTSRNSEIRNLLPLRHDYNTRGESTPRSEDSDIPNSVPSGRRIKVIAKKSTAKPPPSATLSRAPIASTSSRTTSAPTTSTRATVKETARKSTTPRVVVKIKATKNKRFTCHKSAALNVDTSDSSEDDSPAAKRKVAKNTKGFDYGRSSRMSAKVKVPSSSSSDEEP